MKLSILLSQLQELYNKYGGDADVKCYPYDGQMNPSNIESISVSTSFVTKWCDKKKDWIREDTPAYIIISD